jgi:prepilin-type N-terminal cleavage/methylation domain-containing protein
MKKGMTLMELLIAMVILGGVLVVVSSLLRFTNLTHSGILTELNESTGSGARFLDTTVQRILRAKDTKVEDNGKTLIVTNKNSFGGTTHSKITLEGKNLVYYPIANSSENKQVLAKGISQMYFEKDPAFNRKYVAGNEVPDGVWAPIFYFTVKGPERVKMSLTLADSGKTMRTAAVPRFAASQLEYVKWLSPVLIGTLRSVETVDGRILAIVEKSEIAMHTADGFMPVKLDKFYVLLDTDINNYFTSRVGQRVAFMGDVTAQYIAGSPVLRMNPFYSNGYCFGDDAIDAMKKRILAKEEPWYEQEAKRLAPMYEEASHAGVDMHNWQALWDFLAKKTAVAS